jgi:hypothetical protein
VAGVDKNSKIFLKTSAWLAMVNSTELIFKFFKVKPHIAAGVA